MELALWMSRLDPEAEPPAEATASTLLERAIAGDSAAFEQIVRRHERRVLTLAWRLLGSMPDAQDAAQEVFIRAFKYLHRFDPSRALEPWLVRVTVNVCRDLGGKRQKLRRILAESPIDETFPDVQTGDPHAELAARQQKDMVRAALAALPEKERAAVVLRDIEGLSTAEVAEVLGSSEATVRVQISAARVKIKKTIEFMKGGRR
jgi:RNA polymerase sigma-70 factor (ECF subfamily)